MSVTDRAFSPDPADLLAHRPWVRSLARRLVRTDDAVDDVEQETWMSALRSGPAEPRALRSWLGVVARRFALQRLRGDRRRGARQAAVAIAGDAATSADVVAEADAHAHVVQAVMALDEPYRTTVLLRWFEGLDAAAVAARMGVPVDTVKTRLRRAHGTLRERLEREHGGAVALLATLPVSAPATVGIGGALAGAALVAAGIVGVLWGGAWMLSEPPAAAPALVAAAGPVAPQPAPAGQQAPPAAAGEPQPEAAKRIEVRDLADGSLVRGIDVVLKMRDGTTRTLPADRLDVDPAAVVGAALTDVERVWRLAGPDVYLEEKTLWVWREFDVAVDVRVAALDPKSTGSGVHGFGVPRPTLDPPPELEVVWSVRAPGGSEPGGSEPGGSEPGERTRAGSWWLRRHGVRMPERLRIARPARGVLVLRAPRIGGLTIVVGAPGWTPAEVDVPTPSAELPAELQTQITAPKVLSAVLVPSPVVSGTIRDAAKRPREGVTVQLNVLREVDDAGVWPAVAHSTSGGATWRSKADTGDPPRADVCRWSSVTTQADGRFSLCTDAIGRHELVILAPDVAPVRVSIDARTGFADGLVRGLGDLIAEVSVLPGDRAGGRVQRGGGFQFEARSAEPPFPRVALSGLAQPGDKFAIAGTAATGVNWSGVVADDGTVPGVWFEQSQSYRIDVRRPDGTFVATRFFRWTPAPSLDLTALPDKDPEAPR